MADIDPDYIARLIHQQRYGHMERRVCTAGAPMPEADKNRYRWSHPDAIETDQQVPTVNKVVVCHCTAA